VVTLARTHADDWSVVSAQTGMASPMTVADLIAALQKHDPSLLVVSYDSGQHFVGASVEESEMHVYQDGPYTGAYITPTPCSAPHYRCGACESGRRKIRVLTL
jgi:hypothetical protein